MSRTKSQFHERALSNDLFQGPTFVEYDKTGATEFARLFTHYGNLAKNIYRWENLPDGIESRHIERYLFESGQVGFAKDDALGFITLPCSSSGQLNVYGDPLGFTLTGAGYSKQFKADEMVRILNNDAAYPTRLHLQHFCGRMAEMDSISHQNARQQRFPYIIATDKANELTMKNMMKRVMQGEEAIYTDKSLIASDGSVGVQAIPTLTPFLLRELQEHTRELEEHLLKTLGVNTVRGKESGMATEEIDVNNGEINLNLDLGFKTRQMAAEQINAMFGLNIKVVKVIEEIAPIFDVPADGKEGDE